MGRQQRLYGSLIFCLFLSDEDGLWAAPFAQGQSSPQPSTLGPLTGSLAPAVMSFTCAGWTWAAVPIMDKLGDYTLASTFLFFFLLPASVLSFLTVHIVRKFQCLSIFLEAPWNGGQALTEVVLSCWLIFLSLSSVSVSECCFSFQSSRSQKRKSLLLLHFFSLTFDISLQYPETSGIFLFSFF